MDRMRNEDVRGFVGQETVMEMVKKRKGTCMGRR